MQEPQQLRNGSGRRGVFSTYHYVWIGLAMLSSVYLATLALQPGAMDRVASAASHVSGQTRVADGSGRLEALSKNVMRVEEDIAGIRREAATHRDMTASLNNRVAAIEARLDDEIKMSSATREGGASGAAGYTPVKPLVIGGQPELLVPGKAGGALRGNTEVARAPKLPEVINGHENTAGSETNEIVTGSIAQEAPPPPPARMPEKLQRQAAAAAPAVRTPAPATTAAPAEPEKAYGLEIARGMTIEGLRAKWQELAAKNRTQLNGLSPRYRLVVSQDGDPLRLMAGPVLGEAKARRLCTDLAVLGTRCRLTAFGGEPL